MTKESRDILKNPDKYTFVTIFESKLTNNHIVYVQLNSKHYFKKVGDRLIFIISGCNINNPDRMMYLFFSLEKYAEPIMQTILFDTHGDNKHNARKCKSIEELKIFCENNCRFFDYSFDYFKRLIFEKDGNIDIFILATEIEKVLIKSKQDENTQRNKTI